MRKCTHAKHGCYNSAGIWVCGTCWRELKYRPIRPRITLRSEEGSIYGEPSVIEVPHAADIDGMSMPQFIRTVARILMSRMAFICEIEAETYAADIIGMTGAAWGDDDYDWSKEGALEIVNADAESWDCGNAAVGN